MKKKNIIVSLLGLLNMAVQAQAIQLDYLPMSQEGKTWEMQVGGIEENIYGHRIDGDTLINGESWKKVYNYIGFPEFNYSYHVAIRDVGKKVYAIAKGSIKPRLLYDFDMKVGQTVRCGVEGSVFYCLLDTDEMPDTLLGFPLVSYLRLERIDNIIVQGQYHRRFTLTYLDSFHEPIRNEWEAVMDNVVWVEGVGTAAGPFLSWLPLSYKDWIMMNCREGNRNLLFGNRDFNTNVVDAVRDVRRKVNGKDDSYNLQGRRIQGEPLSKSVYIREGMKYVKK